MKILIFRKEESSQVSNPYFFLKKLGKDEPDIVKARRPVIPRTGISEIENSKTMGKNQWNKKLTLKNSIKLIYTRLKKIKLLTPGLNEDYHYNLPLLNG